MTHDGDSPKADAAAALMLQMYAELRAVAGALFRRQPDGHTLQPTAVVHEAWLRLAERDPDSWQSPEHFKATAAQAMRQILCDHARRKGAAKRGAGRRRVTLANLLTPEGESVVDVLAVDAALDRLSELDARQAKVVELRFFGGLTTPEVGQVLGVSTSLVEREWRRARAWMGAELGPDRPS